jgi:hypothetical protein
MAVDHRRNNNGSGKEMKKKICGFLKLILGCFSFYGDVF